MRDFLGPVNAAQFKQNWVSSMWCLAEEWQFRFMLPT